MSRVLAVIALAFVAVLSASPAAGHSEHAATKKKVIPVTACGILKTPNRTYVLQNDVRSAGTCFSIQADDVTLDLGGHTITYAGINTKFPVFGVLEADCWYKTIAGSPCGGSHRHTVIMDGNIVQGPDAAPASHGIQIGQANNLTGVVIHDLKITVSAKDSIGIFLEYLPGGSDIYGNTINNNVKTISNRDQFNGASIKLDNERQAKIPDLIHDNTIFGGAQIGIRDDNPAGTKIYGNDISQDATYANGFCIDAAGDNMMVYRNHCHPIHGRGLHANHSGVQIFDNVIDTLDSDQIREYNGCEIHGTYGIQVENDGFDPTNIRVYGNRVTVHAAGCPAVAMRLTDLKNADVEIYGNSFIAVQDKESGSYSSQAAYGFCVGDVQGTHIRFFSNMVRTDTAIFSIDWDNGSQITLNNNKFEAGRLGPATLLADFENNGASQQNNFIDNTYDGLSPTSAKFGNYAADSWYEIMNSVHLDVTGTTGRIPEDLTGIATGDASQLHQQGTIDGSGNMTFTLPAMRIENDRPPVTYADYHVMLKARACIPDAFVVSSDHEQSLKRQLSCQ